ncbi:MAG: DinB family protein [Firmicutes bacterium]|nr:DinB family protein [Bacillota bacterium]
MDIRDWIQAGLKASRSGLLRALQGSVATGAAPAQTASELPELPREQLLWRPAPGSHGLGQLIWHIADAEDRLCCTAIRQEPFVRRFGARAFDPGAALPAWQDLMDYLDSTRMRTVQAVAGLSLADLDAERDFYGHPLPLGILLQQIIYHEAYHAGQIAHILGMIRREGWV